MNELVLGLLTGLLFGALLQQGRVMRFEKQLGANIMGGLIFGAGWAIIGYCPGLG